MPERKVLADRFSWTEDDGQYRYARKGDVVNVPKAEVERGERLGALGPADEDLDDDGLLGSTAHPAEETAKVLGVVLPDDEEAEPGTFADRHITDPYTSAYPAEETAKVAGLPTEAPEPAGAVDPDEAFYAGGHDPDAVARVAGILNPERVEEPGTAGAVDDDTLAGYTVAEVVAYLNQHPDEVDRVDAIEDQRDRRRNGVDDAIEAHRNAADE